MVFITSKFLLNSIVLKGQYFTAPSRSEKPAPFLPRRWHVLRAFRQGQGFARRRPGPPEIAGFFTVSKDNA